MNQDLDKIEEDLKQKAEQKREQKKSGRSVFKLQEIIASRGNLQKQIIKEKSEKEIKTQKEDEEK